MEISSRNLNLRQITDSGQCFRMVMEGEDRAFVTAYGRRLMIEDKGEGRFDLSCSSKEYESIWRSYFDMDTDYSEYIGAIDRKDGFLMKAAEYGEGIRILRQEPFETLISFIISQRKNIPAIRSSVERLCRLAGNKISGDIYAFPKPEAICALSDEELSGCSLGYRTEYVREAAEGVSSGRIDLDGYYSLSDDELMEELMSIKGVGRKVANCVMLFAYHRIGAFPVDVWIERIVDRYYEGRFPAEKYEGFAGVMQQYMFFYGRGANRE